jgi:hypothetical protein
MREFPRTIAVSLGAFRIPGQNQQVHDGPGPERGKALNGANIVRAADETPTLSRAPPGPYQIF